MKPTILLTGIDVSARSLTVVVEQPGGDRERLEFANDSVAHRQLIRRLTKQGRHARVALEASGIYSLDLALALDRAPRIEVMVINPRAARDFAKAFLHRSKTDELDAEVLLEFVRRMPFLPWQPPPTEALELRAVTRRMAALIKTRSQEKNRLHAARHCHALSDLVRNDIEVNIRHLDRRIALLEEQAVDLIWEHPELRLDLLHLTSVRGIARTSAVQILAELGVLPPDLSARQLVAHAGIDPRSFESGESVAKPARISRVGNRYLRAALYMPALVASRYEPHVKAFYDMLIARGKKPKQALVAVMRKLLHSIYGMLKHGCDFEGQKFFAMPQEA
jgi:transposase